VSEPGAHRHSFGRGAHMFSQPLEEQSPVPTGTWWTEGTWIESVVFMQSRSSRKRRWQSGLRLVSFGGRCTLCSRQPAGVEYRASARGSFGGMVARQANNVLERTR
jgi:hypothetical protein